jgi:hypothetical protein
LLDGIPRATSLVFHFLGTQNQDVALMRGEIVANNLLNYLWRRRQIVTAFSNGEEEK